MARTKFTIFYPNGMKRYVSRLERDVMGTKLKQISPREYVAPSFEIDTTPQFYPGRFTIQHTDGCVTGERLESVGAMTKRLFKQGVLANA